MPKVIKKETAKKSYSEEKVHESLIDIKVKLQQRFRLITLIGAISFVILASVIGYFLYNKSITEKALLLEYEGYKILYGQFQPKPELSEDRFSKALEKFKESYKIKKNPVVLYYIANCYYEIGNYDEAIKTLQDLINNFKESKIVSYSYYRLAMVYNRKNDIDNSLNTLKTLSRYQEGVLQDLALIEMAKIFESIGKAEEAKNAYKEIIEKYPQSVFVNEAKLRVGEK